MRKLILLQIVGNALLLWLGYYWLGLGESRTATLAWSAFVALALVAFECWLQGATFTWIAGRRSMSVSRLVPLVIAAAVLLAIYVVLTGWSNTGGGLAFHIASWLTMTSRKPVKPESVLRVIHGAWWLVRWMIVPSLALPAIAHLAVQGWRGLRFPARRWWYWIAVPLLLLCAFELPLKLMGWKPYSGNFSLEMVSFVARLAASYLLFVAAWLALVFLTSGGRPRAIQPSTAVSP